MQEEQASVFIPRVCSWNALTDDRVKYCTWGPEPSNQASYAETQGCISVFADDPLSSDEKYLISLGCSLPVKWQAYRNGWYAIAYMQLCPYSQALDSYVDSHQTPMQDSYFGNSIEPASQSWSFTDSSVPHPPLFYQWVVPWQCPTCPMNGCPEPMPATPTRI
jgi:hypothetical protein